MDNMKIDYNPPDDWVEKLKPGDYVHYLIDGLIYQVQHVIQRFDKILVYVNAPFEAFFVFFDGSSGERQIILPFIKNTFPKDAGDGE